MADYGTKEAVLELGKTNPEYAEYVSKLEHPPFLPFAELVATVWSQPSTKPPDTALEFARNIPMRDGYMSELRIHKPATSSSPGGTAATATTDATPLVVVIHGGGFCVGDNAIPSSRCRSLAALYGVTVVSLSYRLAPRFPFPAAPNDIWDSLMWLVAEGHAASELGCDLSKGFYIGGASAGANLSAVSAQRWVSEGVEGRPPIRGLWLSVPYVLEDEFVPDRYRHLYLSREQNAGADIINADALDYVRDAYQPDLTSPSLSPFLASPSPHVGMPPVYFQVAGQDPLRDDGLIYQRVLRDHGVSTRLDVYPGVPHAFEGMFSSLNIARKFEVDILLGFGWLLGRKVSKEQCEKLVANES